VFDSVLPHDRGHGTVLPASVDEIPLDCLSLLVQANDAKRMAFGRASVDDLGDLLFD